MILQKGLHGAPLGVRRVGPLGLEGAEQELDHARFDELLVLLGRARTDHQAQDRDRFGGDASTHLLARHKGCARVQRVCKRGPSAVGSLGGC